MKDYSELYENNMKTLNHAINCCSGEYSHEDIINELKSDDDIKKQLCIIEIKTINSQEEADLLLYNLTGKSGPVREAASFKILELIQNEKYTKFFQSENIIDTLCKGITDINPAVSRNITDAIKYVYNVDYLISNIINNIKLTLNSMDDIKQNRSYKSNKKNFNLYWNLEALINLGNKFVINQDIIDIINIVYKSNDYTIREKAAKFICTVKNNVFDDIAEILKNDENIYVKKYFDDYDILLPRE